MKRRLTKAYDHMTMPDACAHRIEQRLQQEQELKQAGQYTKVIAPTRARRGGWAAAAAAVCLMLVLSVGGTALLLWTSDHMRTARQETIASVSTEMTEMPAEPAEENQKKQVPQEFTDVLSGQSVKITGSGEMTLDEYTAALWGSVRPSAFAVVDMDRDNVCETVALVETEQGVDYGFLVLRLEGEEICAYPFRYGEMYNLKKDGSFNRSDDISNSKMFRLSFEGAGISRLHSEEEGQQDLPVVDWYVYPCQGVELLLQSLEYAGMGQSVSPGTAYYTFEGLVLGTTGNDWTRLKEQLTGWGMICLEEEGTVIVLDPDAPGTVLYGTLTNENGWVQFSELGYYFYTEQKEYQAEVRALLSDNPHYMVDVMDPAKESSVQYPEFVVDYFGWKMGPDADAIEEKYAAKATVQEFTALYFSNDTQGMNAYLADDYRGYRNGYTPAGTAEILAIHDLPEQVMAAGEVCPVIVELREPGQDSYSYFDLELVKDTDGSWKVKSYGLEK